MTEFWNAVQPAVANAAVGIFSAVIAVLGSMAVAALNKWRQQITAKIGADEYNKRLTIAKQVWGAVDEYFRITPAVTKTITSATTKFAELMRKALPTITEDEIKQLQAIMAGQVNAGRTAFETPAPEVSVSAVNLPADTADTDATEHEVEGTDMTAEASQAAAAPTAKTA